MPGVFIPGLEFRGTTRSSKKKARQMSGLILETWRVFTQSCSLEKPIFWSVDANSVRVPTWPVIDLSHVLVFHLKQNCCQILNYFQSGVVDKLSF